MLSITYFHLESQGTHLLLPAKASTYRCCRKPRKGATPVPGPTMTTGTEGSLGKWNEFAARGEMNIWNITRRILAEEIRKCKFSSKWHHYIKQQHYILSKP